MAKKKPTPAPPDPSKPKKRHWLDPRVIVGNDHTGVIHRLTIRTDGSMRMERTRYVSAHSDGWSQDYEDQKVEASNYYWLIDRIETNPCPWPG
ncbi:hypothetical protein A6C57_00070 [Fibrella sp. ES10-3-2-2]|nr:hypothetical protein A6C57_00070 [Fibrella sp. ES10-3-2-2]